MLRGDGLAPVCHLGDQLADEAVGLLGGHGEKEADHHLRFCCRQKTAFVLHQAIAEASTLLNGECNVRANNGLDVR